MTRRVRTWAEFREEWNQQQSVSGAAVEGLENQVAALHARLDVRQTGQETQPVRIRGTQFVDEEAKANASMAHLTGICPKCGDGGWWIDDQGRHLCDCPEGLRQAAEALKAAST